MNIADIKNSLEAYAVSLKIAYNLEPKVEVEHNKVVALVNMGMFNEDLKTTQKTGFDIAIAHVEVKDKITLTINPMFESKQILEINSIAQLEEILFKEGFKVLKTFN